MTSRITGDVGGKISGGRIMHRDDIRRSHAGIENILSAFDPVRLDHDLTVIPTQATLEPYGSAIPRPVSLAGDHLRWSDSIQPLARLSRCLLVFMDGTDPLDGTPARLRLQWVLPGHGRRAHRTIGEMRQHLRDCITRMKSIDDSGLTIDDCEVVEHEADNHARYRHVKPHG
jgi:hypothetical protein